MYVIFLKPPAAISTALGLPGPHQEGSAVYQRSRRPLRRAALEMTAVIDSAWGKFKRGRFAAASTVPLVRSDHASFQKS